MVPVRFIVACENGHVDDFPWLEWAHSRPGESLADAKICSAPALRLNYSGKAGLMGLIVMCENPACDAKRRSLMGSAGPKALDGLICSGKRPWLGPNGKVPCDPPCQPRMVQRGATNLYFPKVASAILIPPFSDPLRALIDDPHNWSVFTGGVQETDKIDDDKLRFFAELKRLDLASLKEAVAQKLAGDGIPQDGQTEEEFRFSEYQALLTNSKDRQQEFVTVSQSMDAYSETIQEYFDEIVLVEKLAETRTLTGFTRINPPPYREFSEQDKLVLSLQQRNWLPAVRVYGEGLFLKIRDDVIEKWAAGEVVERFHDIIANHARVYQKLGRQPRLLPPKFFLLHTLAHILVRRMSYECGYGSSSLRERLYCCSEPEMEMSGILIYTAAGDCEGTMGGLVQQGKPGRFESLLCGAIEDAMWCSSDPLCVESRGQGIDSLNRAACHACTLLPETSCEEGNRFLDRVALIGTPAEPELGFFGELVAGMRAGAR